jgi:tape measure domain-containing protein
MAVKNIIFKIEADVASLKRELAGVNTSVDNTEKKVTSLGKAFSLAGAAFGGIAIGSQFAELAKQSINAAAAFETLEISFSTFLGSAEEGARVLKELEQFSLKTPFTPAQVQEAGKALLAFGEPVEKLTATLKNIGDISAGTGKNFNELAIIYGKARTQGTLYAEDINQLTEAGIPIIDTLAESLGTSAGNIKKLASEGKIGFSDLEKGFRTLTSSGGQFEGLTEKLAQSTAGRLSTLQGNAEAIRRSFGESLLPVFEVLINTATQVLSFFGNFNSILEANRAAFAAVGAAIALSVGAMTRDIQLKVLSNAVTLALAIKERALAVATNIKTTATRIATTASQGATFATRVQTVATEVATIATKGFNAAIKANPLGILITLLTTAAILFVDFADAADASATQVERFADGAKAFGEFEQSFKKNLNEEKAALAANVEQIKKSNAGSQERAVLIKKLNDQFGTTLTNLTDEKKFVAALEVAYLSATEAIKKKALASAGEEALTNLYKEQIRLTEILNANLEEKKKISDSVNAQFATSDVAVDKIIESRTGIQTAQINNSKKELALVNSAIDKISKRTAEAIGGPTDPINIPVSVELINSRAKLAADLEKELRGLKIDLSQQGPSFVDPKNVEEAKKQAKDLADVDRARVDEEINNRIKEFKNNETYTSATAKLLDDIKKKKLEIIANQEANQLQIIDINAAERDSKALRSIEETSFEEKIFLAEESNKRLEELQQESLDKLSKATKAKDKETIQSEINARLDLIRQGLEKERQLREAAIIAQRNADLGNVKLSEKEKAAITAKSNLEILKLNQNYLDKKTAAGKEAGAKTTEDDLKVQQEITQGIINLTKESLSALKEISAARIQEADLAISNQQKRVERAAKLAENGNVAILESEQEKLDNLVRARQQYVRQQQVLGLIEMTTNSAIAISKAAAEGGAAAPFTIAATLIALAAGFVAAKAQAQAAGGFEKGGYTGDGARREPAGIVHKGEFVFTQEKTRRFRSVFEDIHKGRDPFVARGVGEKIIFVNNSGLDGKLDKIERAIREQQGLNLSISEKGIHGLVSSYQFKESRIKKGAR